MAIRDDMEDVQEAVINELITENGITNTLADGQVTPAKLDRDYLESTGGSVSGNLLVGQTSASNTANGTYIRTGDRSGFNNTNGACVSFNRLSSDGDIVEFRKDGSTKGTIGVRSGTDPYFVSPEGSGTGLKMEGGINAVVPISTNGSDRDNVVDLGKNTGGRFDDIYATNGTIQTSDRNEKQDIAELSDAEQRVAVAAKGLLRKFHWKSAVEEKGEEARIHFGIIAQDLQAAFEAEGLDAGRYAMFISSTWTDEETGEEKTRLGVRYSELLAFIISAI